MGTKSGLVVLAIVIVTISLLAGQFFGYPLGISYVETGSMEPSLNPGDGFVAVPTALTGSIDEGDVVVFKPEALHEGQYTTHRVVDETDEGFITKGDANPFTDQDGGEPIVKEPQVVAEALSIDGQVVAIPALGTALTLLGNLVEAFQRVVAHATGTAAFLGTVGLGYLIFAITCVWYLLDVARTGTERVPTRDTTRATGTSVRLLLGLFAVMIVVGATAAMVVPAGPDRYNVVSSDVDAPGPGVVLTGQSESFEKAVANSGVVPVVVFVEPVTEGIDVKQSRLYVESGEQLATVVTVTAPPETGYYRHYLVEHRYLAVLPQSVIDALYELHPWAPIVVIDALLAGGFLVLTLPFAPGGRIRTRSRDSGGLFDTATRRFKRLFG